MVFITKLFLSNIIAPVGRSWDSFFLHGPAVTDDFLAERPHQGQADREPF
jgi:antitoxin VapB